MVILIKCIKRVYIILMIIEQFGNVLSVKKKILINFFNLLSEYRVNFNWNLYKYIFMRDQYRFMQLLQYDFYFKRLIFKWDYMCIFFIYMRIIGICSVQTYRGYGVYQRFFFCIVESTRLDFCYNIGVELIYGLYS